MVVAITDPMPTLSRNDVMVHNKQRVIEMRSRATINKSLAESLAPKVRDEQQNQELSRLFDAFLEHEDYWLGRALNDERSAAQEAIWLDAIEQLLRLDEFALARFERSTSQDRQPTDQRSAA
jgi:hypothetical protein